MANIAPPMLTWTRRTALPSVRARVRALACLLQLSISTGGLLFAGTVTVAAAGGQKRIDASLLPAIAGDLRSGQLRPGRHSIDKVLTTIGPAAGVMLDEVLAEPIPTYPLAAELLGKVGDEAARDKGAAEM